MIRIMFCKEAVENELFEARKEIRSLKNDLEYYRDESKLQRKRASDYDAFINGKLKEGAKFKTGDIVRHLAWDSQKMVVSKVFVKDYEVCYEVEFYHPGKNDHVRATFREVTLGRYKK